MIVSDRNSKLGQRGGENVGFLVLEEIKNNSPLLGWRFQSRTRKKQNAPCESRRSVLCTIFGSPARIASPRLLAPRSVGHAARRDKSFRVIFPRGP